MYIEYGKLVYFIQICVNEWRHIMKQNFFFLLGILLSCNLRASQDVTEMVGEAEGAKEVPVEHRSEARNSLNGSERESKNRFVCGHEGCHYKAASSSALIVHERVHTGERPYACEYPGCKYRAVQKGMLNRHTALVHAKEKKFACDYPECTYTSGTRHSLLNHKAMKHNEIGKLHCDHPGCKFQTPIKACLVRHQAIHLPKGEQPHMCKHPGCNYRSAFPYNLKKHVSNKHGSSRGE